MPITQYLERNATEYADEVCLVEINPEIQEKKRVTWRDYELIEANPYCDYRREITWAVFDEKANRFANLLISRGIKKGDKVGILLMNCLEWLPIYFGILKTGALAVPLNFRYDAEEIVLDSDDIYCSQPVLVHYDLQSSCKGLVFLSFPMEVHTYRYSVKDERGLCKLGGEGRCIEIQLVIQSTAILDLTLAKYSLAGTGSI